MPFKHLTADDRAAIATLLGEGRDRAYIARRLHVDHSTVSREVKRNSQRPQPPQQPLPTHPAILAVDGRSKRGTGFASDKHEAAVAYAAAVARVKRQNQYYVAATAHKQARARRAAANRSRMKLVHGSGGWLEKYLLEQLTHKQWSPEQIAGELRRNHSVTIWPQVIYDYIYTSPEKKALLRHLRRGGNPYRHRHGTNARSKARRAKLPSIHDRGLVVEQRARLGDWEGDTVVGLDHKDRILTHVERASGEGRLGLVLGYDAHKIAEHTVRTLAKSPVSVRTITYDRGSEFADWELVQRATGSRVYFADAYSSWQRGTDENLNGLVRQYYPKRSDFKGITSRQLKRTERKLNTRPRKRYNYRTPIQQREFLGWSVKFGGVAIRGRI